MKHEECYLGGDSRPPIVFCNTTEARAWNRRVNRDRVKIAWKFDRKTARRKFGYNRKSFKRSKTLANPGTDFNSWACYHLQNISV